MGCGGSTQTAGDSTKKTNQGKTPQGKQPGQENQQQATTNASQEFEDITQPQEEPMDETINLDTGNVEDADQENTETNDNYEKESLVSVLSVRATKGGNAKGAAASKANSKGQGRNGAAQNGRANRPPKENREPVNEKGHKKRIRERLMQATKGFNVEELETAIELFEKNKLEDNGDLEDAKERLVYLKLRKGLKDAILRRHPGILEKAIEDAENSDYRADLQKHIDHARQLKAHMDELDKYRHDILAMDQNCISEIRSYHHPPEGVHETMMSTYLILGYEEDQLKSWVDVQSLLGRYGKESILREVRNADTVNLDDHTTKKVKKLQSKFSLEEIRMVSAGCATFYVWNENMCQKFSKDQANDRNQTKTPGGQSQKTNKTSNSAKGQQISKGNPSSPSPQNDQNQKNVQNKTVSNQSGNKVQPNANANKKTNTNSSQSTTNRNVKKG